MEIIDTDVLVAGGGIAGLAATARIAAAGVRAVCVDPMPGDARGSDLRTTAFLQPAVQTLATAGAWGAMAAGAAELRVMRLVDAGGRERGVREVADFRAGEVAPGSFGWNVPNRDARAALVAAIGAAEGAELIGGTRVEEVVPRTAHALARLSDGRQVRSALVVAADGRDSELRTAAGIAASRWHYGQKALVFAVGHGRPHGGVSTEIHRTGGPLTLVPMPDADGHRSAVVWMVPGPRAAVLEGLSDEALGHEITAETMELYGPLTVVGPRAAWPIIGQLAHRLGAERLALIAEAAHVVPPIGAQGLNMSLADVETLAELAGLRHAAGGDIGAPDLIAAYERARLPEMVARAAGIDTLNRAARAEAQPLRDLRRIGLKAIHDIPPLRRLAMRTGLGLG
ncbi:MAG TPA: FAD-dependent monooxygenase [Thermohalobaculum sp.]|nr:FAD-dependent monooxygenase [Thermohalobaculum sp.]